LPNSRVNPWTIQRIVDSMPASSTEEQVRAKVRACCPPVVPLGSPHYLGWLDYVKRCEEAGVRYFRKMVPAGRK
jgi:hypothetical protein